jgi:hypothetical protein
MLSEQWLCAKLFHYFALKYMTCVGNNMLITKHQLMHLNLMQGISSNDFSKKECELLLSVTHNAVSYQQLKVIKKYIRLIKERKSKYQTGAVRGRVVGRSAMMRFIIKHQHEYETNKQ